MDKKLTLKKRGESSVLLEELVKENSIVTVGNNAEATILLDDGSIAPEQFVVLSEGSDVVLMNRADGTKLNGEVLNLGTRIALDDGDRVEVGEYELHFGTPKSIPVKAVKTRKPKNGKKRSIVNKKKKEVTEIPVPVAEKDFSKILYELKEEDSFYFNLKAPDGVVERVAFEHDQMWIGTKLGIVAVVPDEALLDEVHGRINKDWSGVVIYPREDQKIKVLDKNILEPKRLRNEDVICLIDDFEGEQLQTTISFHEPISLLALSSILPADLPEPVLQVSPKAHAAKTGKDSIPNQVAPRGLGVAAAGPHLIFGYFSLIEIVIMTMGTIVTAAIIFFVLEYV